MTAEPRSLPPWLVDAVLGLVASAYEAGRTEGAAAAQPTTVATQTVLSRQEAAQALRCSVTKLDRLIMDGALRSVKVGNQRLVRREDIDAYLERHVQESAA